MRGVLCRLVPDPNLQAVGQELLFGLRNPFLEVADYHLREPMHTRTFLPAIQLFESHRKARKGI